ncbi:S9 family peptidase [Methylocystis sp. MJC1]|jgi:oligopeptidase B|uniref:S9 family peptidase n=1 Tax=Methylocystis sp. MJC1 TaxID=2654282 RepID=UPI0013EB591C|nr:S9 family peptidase [Methylocystis sp. MJC1]KAF2990416.1 Dipeptidyl aminopeptidase BI [Methylocystis sp. MJC1]MBU6528211.1 S9 family peptidase [Methylocystis sp. MJC1]UZX11120.1 S9 family peptidase [Methylocystis sp. MJC1]
MIEIKKRDSAQFDLTSTPPIAERRPCRKATHDRVLDDPYGWFAAENWRDVLRDPKTLPKDIAALVKAENAYCAKVVAPLKELRKTLVKEMRGRIKEDDADVPDKDGPYAYYGRFRDGAEHPLYCRTPRDGGPETVLLDGEALAEGHDFFDIGDTAQSPDHAQLAWSVDDKGSELYAIRTRALCDGKDRDDVVNDTDGAVVWSADSTAFYYVRIDENHRTAQVFRHVVGADPKADRLIVEEKDGAWFVGLDESRCRRFAIVTIRGHDASECWLIDLRDAEARPRLVAKREPKLRYDIEPHGDLLYIHNNANGCDDFRISVAPLDAPQRANWRDVAPHRAGAMIVTFTVFKRYLVWMLRENSLPRIVVRDLETNEEHAIAFEEEAYALELDAGLEFDTAQLRFVYASMTTPEETYDYDMGARTRVLRKRQEIPSRHDPKNYVTRRIFAPAQDGESIPVTLLHRADFTPGGNGAPLLLYGYGAYGHSLAADFDEDALSLVDRGFVYALAHTRGGTDKGWGWYENGKLDKKTNTFSDFIACARHLIACGYTREGAIVAQGASAAGMLMGAIVNEAPQLFAGVIAGVPFVDVLNTMLRDDLPLTPPEWLEWGNPIADPEVYDRIASYSPYDNIRAQNYPPILSIAGLTDPRVTYWEPLKWVAKLRATMTGGGPVLLHTHMGAGHAGASGRFEALEDTALEYAFAIACAARLT